MWRPSRVAVAADPVERHQHADEAGEAVGAGDLDADEPRARGDAAVAASPASSPAITPAMCEPWPNVSRPAQVGIAGVLGEVGAADELARRRRARRRRCTPESISATSTPAPVRPSPPAPVARADQVHRGAGAGRAVVGLRRDRGDRVGDRVLHDRRRCPRRDGDRVGRERAPAASCAASAIDLVGDLVGRLRRSGSRPAAGRSRGSASASTRPPSVDSVQRACQRATLRTAADARRSRGDRRRRARGR